MRFSCLGGNVFLFLLKAAEVHSPLPSVCLQGSLAADGCLRGAVLSGVLVGQIDLVAMMLTGLLDTPKAIAVMLGQHRHRC